MRVISLKTLKNFWNRYPDARSGLQDWHDRIRKAKFQTPSDVTKAFKGADYVGNTRIIFNIAKNKYRLVAAFRYDKQICWVIFIGSHSEYDAIDPKTVGHKQRQS